MNLSKNCVKGQSKQIVHASPVQVSSIKKKYLKSLSPGRISEVVKNPASLSYPLPARPNTKHLQRTSKWVKKFSLDFFSLDPLSEDILEKKDLKTFAFRGLRINNL